MTIDSDDWRIAKSWLKNRKNWRTNGPIIADFENNFAKYNGSKFAYSFMGGRVALSAAIYALNIKPYEEVIVPGYTCVVVPNAFRYEKIQVKYSDIELETYGLDFKSLVKLVTPKTKAILVHHLYGLVSRDYLKIIDFAKQNKILVIEDCAQSLGASLNRLKIGNLGDIAIYSFEQSKVITTILGGMVITNNSSFAARLKEFQERSPFPNEKKIENILWNIFSRYSYYKHPLSFLMRDITRLFSNKKEVVSTPEDEINGIIPDDYGCRMPPPLAAIGINQLNKLDYYNSRRKAGALKWKQWCIDNKYKTPLVIKGSEPIYLRFPVLVEKEKKTESNWAKETLNIELGKWFLTNIHPSDEKVDNCPNSNIAVSKCINFPSILPD